MDYNSIINKKQIGDIKMYGIIYYNEKIQDNVIVYASSNFDMVYKMYVQKYQDNDFHDFKIVTL